MCVYTCACVHVCVCTHICVSHDKITSGRLTKLAGGP